MKKWIIQSPDKASAEEMHRRSDLSMLSCLVLASQGCVTLQQAQERIGCQQLSDPFLLCDMQIAADTILAAVDEGRRICIYGDYDCDGIMATVILFSFLSDIGADVTWYIPERSEGYGLNENAVRCLCRDGTDLIVTVDNGISALKESALIAELGMELVVTDHHLPGSELPHAAAIVDAHREDNYSPFRMYCGAGVALLLVAAMNDGDTEMALEQFGDLAAIATIADVVSLTGENRYLVQKGLEYLENTERPGLTVLRELCGLKDKPYTSSAVSFSIAPRINAAGRMASPALAVELLLEEDPVRAAKLAENLCQTNTDRRSCEAEIMQSVMEQLASQPELMYERVLIFSGEGWHVGVIGIVASRLMERFGKPCFIISTENGTGHGSARSFGSFSVFKALTACDSLLVKYGGHPAAGGFTISAENIQAFRETLLSYAHEAYPDMPVMELRASCALQPDFLTVEEAESLSQLEPFGCDQPEPVFFAENVHVTEVRPLSEGTHTKLLVQFCGISAEALQFGISPENIGVRAGDTCHMMARLSVSQYMGRKKVSLLVQEIRASGIKQSKLLSAAAVYDKYRRHEQLPPVYYAAMYPDRETLTFVYKNVPEKGITMQKLTVIAYNNGISYCKLRICLDVFEELGLVRISSGAQSAKRLPAVKKADLESSEILDLLRSMMKETE